MAKKKAPPADEDNSQSIYIASWPRRHDLLQVIAGMPEPAFLEFARVCTNLKKTPRTGNVVADSFIDVGQAANTYIEKARV